MYRNKKKNFSTNDISGLYSKFPLLINGVFYEVSTSLCIIIIIIF